MDCIGLLVGNLLECKYQFVTVRILWFYGMRSAAEFGGAEDRPRGKINELNVIKRIHLMQIICTQDSLSAADKVNAHECVYSIRFH